MSSNLKKGRDSILALMSGVQIAYDAVKGTIGAKGANVIIEESDYPFHRVTNDGATIIEHLHSDDPLQKQGLSFVKEATDRSNRNSRDGSTATVILLNSILEEGYKTGLSGMEIKKSLDELVPKIEELIDNQTKPITIKDIDKVATTASESEEIGALFKEIYQKIGKDGVINYEGTDTEKTSYTFVDGVRLEGAGFLSPSFVHDPEARRLNLKESRAVYEKPTILVTKRKITHQNDINPLIKTLESLGKRDIVIFTDDMDSGVARLMVNAHQTGILNICIIKAPILWKNYAFEDFAKITGATIVEDASGVNFKNLQIQHLGTCDKITIDANETVVTGIQDISDHIADLKARGDDDSLLRVSRLTTKSVNLKIGAGSETELSYLLPKIDDTIGSCRLALEGGIVAGGGVCLLNTAYEIENAILKESLRSPYKQIAENGGYIAIENYVKGVGVDVKTGISVDMFKAGIVDSAIVVKNAVKTAINIAGTILTADGIILKPPKTQEQLLAELQANQMKF